MGSAECINIFLSIYKIYSDDLQKYNSIIWQFPTALITVNILFLHYFFNNTHVLFFISLANFMLLHALFKHIHHQKAIINALKNIEIQLRNYYLDGIIPDFEPKNRILKIHSTYLVFYTLVVFNSVYFLYISIDLLNIIIGFLPLH